MQTKASLVGANGAVELNAVAGVDLNLSLVVNPRNAEFNLSFRIYQTFQKGVFPVFFFIGFDDNSQRFQNFLYSLMKLRLRRILLNHFRNDFIYV